MPSGHPDTDAGPTTTIALTHDEVSPTDQDASQRQLDLFVDGRDALLVYEVVAALLARDADRAETGLQRLRQEQPDHIDLTALNALVEALTAWPPACLTHATLTERIEVMERTLGPAAQRFLGKDAPDFLRPLWQTLAGAAVHLPFDHAHPRAHRGWLWQRLGEWAEVRAAVEAEPGWTAVPLLRYWLGLAQHHLDAPEAAIHLWLPLCWIDPLLFAQWAPTLPSLTLSSSWAAFERAAPFEQSGAGPTPAAAWFPAWLLLRHRGLARLFRADEIPEAGQATRVFCHLLSLVPLERHGLSDELIRQRRALQQLDRDFFRYYMEAVSDRAAVSVIEVDPDR